MITRLQTIVVACGILVFAGCAQQQAQQQAQSSLVQEGWTRVGQVAVSPDRDEDVIAAGHLAGTYRSICVQSDGPAQIHRIVLTYLDGSVFLPESGLTFDGADRQILNLPGNPRGIDRIALVYSGGGAFRKTILTVWAR